MLTELKNWKGQIQIHDTIYDTIDSVPVAEIAKNGSICIKLLPKCKMKQETQKISVPVEIKDEQQEVKLFVKQYMTKKASPEFDFMAKWNNNNPMPMREMVGVKIKETKGMVYYKLHGFAQETITCACCGKELTNPVSRFYGIGPICLSKLGIACDIADVEQIKEKLVQVQWEGWIIRSSIISKEIVE